MHNLFLAYNSSKVQTCSVPSVFVGAHSQTTCGYQFLWFGEKHLKYSTRSAFLKAPTGLLRHGKATHSLRKSLGHYFSHIQEVFWGPPVQPCDKPYVAIQWIIRAACTMHVSWINTVHFNNACQFISEQRSTKVRTKNHTLALNMFLLCLNTSYHRVWIKIAEKYLIHYSYVNVLKKVCTPKFIFVLIKNAFWHQHQLQEWHIVSNIALL